MENARRHRHKGKTEYWKWNRNTEMPSSILPEEWEACGEMKVKIAITKCIASQTPGLFDSVPHTNC